jgi:hypothetical protein
MDVITKYLNRVAYKFPKGYPDMNNDQDVLLLESLISETIGEKFSLDEANMVGSATGFSGPLGTWEKYIENAWNKHESGETLYKSLRTTPAFSGSSSDGIEKTNITINAGDEFTINSNSIKDLIKRGSSYYGPIGYKGEEYYYPLNSILKPTGKQVEKLTPDLSTKSDPSVYHQFTPGHPQEAKAAMLFINETNEDWEFEHKGKQLKVTYLGDPNFKGVGYPKNDLQINISPPPEGLTSPLKVSLKADNATYVENWMTSTRGEQILGSKLKPIVLGAYNALLKSNPLETATGLFLGKLKSYQICMFIKDRQQKYGPEAPSILSEPLTKEEAYEAYTGDAKFGDSDGSANYFYKGKNPETISEFLSDLTSFKNNMGDLADLYVSLRGSNEGGKSKSRVFYFEDGKWFINPLWVGAAGISKSEDKNGNIKYN